MKFIDEVSVRVKAGRGGAGAVNFRREKYVPRGGPDGGNGGSGGAVIFVAVENLNTLVDLALNPLIRAEHGSPGGQQGLHGKDGSVALSRVPVGTQVYYQEELVADLSVAGARWVAARGGKGGLGNAAYKSPTRQAPDTAGPGQEGEAWEFKLVLKSVADVGLVGIPNVGKSSLVKAISAATPKVADYPFTTLQPTLGVVLVDDDFRFVAADIPGLISGAHQGKGLGIDFLKHLERTRALAQLIDVSTPLEPTDTQVIHSESPTDDDLLDLAMRQFDCIEHELRSFAADLSTRPRLVVFTKADIELNRRAYELSRPIFSEKDIPTCLVSSHTQEGLNDLKQHLCSLLTEASG